MKSPDATSPDETGAGRAGPAVIVRVFAPFAFGYFLSYAYRAVNAVIAPELLSELRLNADDLGFLTSAFFLSFAAAQLPLGIALDRWGPRRIEAALLLVAALGALVFANANGLFTLIAGRALIGFGVSACLMAAFKAFILYFPPSRLPLVNGCQMAAGGLGAMSATVPAQALAAAYDWRAVIHLLGFLSVVAAAVIFFVVPRDREHAQRAGAPVRGGELAGVGAILKSARFWRVAPATVASQASFLAIQGLWVGPWLHDVGGLTGDAVAGRLLAIAAAMIAGFLLLGFTAERLSRRGIAPIAVAIGGMSAFATVLATIVVSASSAPLLWLAFGFFGTSGILPYAALSQQFPPALAGRLNTTLNVLVFPAAFAAQWGMGAIIAHWHGAAGVGHNVAGYRAAFTVMLSLQGLTLAWFALFRPRRGRRG